jgi:general nucleoside transport system ATP-binding protein
LLVANGISKRFARTVALDNASFCARAGEIHALVGENGAGKSTLVNIFAGRLRADSGQATLGGVPLRAGSPHAALRAGIAAVFQSPMLFERMSWEQNLALGGFGGENARLDLGAVADRARQLADQLGFALPPAGATVEERSVAERVRLEILRALSFDPRVLILDEPTGVLAPDELAAFLETLRRLRAQGRIVVLVTHKLAEALAVADRVTVLRHGHEVGEKIAAETGKIELAQMMIGELPPSARRPLYYQAGGHTALKLDRLVLDRDGHRALDGVSFTLAAGEIAGVAGVDGNGQAELIEVLAGLRTPLSGYLRLGDGAEGAMAVVPQNRDLDGLVLEMTLWENLMLTSPLRRRFTGRGGWIQRRQAHAFCAELLAKFDIRASGADAGAAALSGGNRQRLAVARALATNPRVLVAHDICRGLDLRATADVHRMLREYSAGGGAVLLISCDLDELLALCGRLAVMCRGRLTEISGADRDPVRIGLLMSGAAT